MSHYNALDNRREAAKLAVNLHLEAEDLSSAIDYNMATWHDYPDDVFDRDQRELQDIRDLVKAIRAYCGEDEWQQATSAQAHL